MSPDKPVAETLQRVLETFPIPGQLKNSVVSRGLWRSRLKVFRDITDLNASPDLDAALKQKLRCSRFLIVVCTPNLPKSDYCTEEFRYFSACHGAHCVLYLLVEGEPDESFPPTNLRQLEDDDECVNLVSNSELNSATDTLAADIRAENTCEILRKLRGKGVPRAQQARFKLLATILGCRSPDDLVQRDRARFRTNVLTYSMVILSALLVFTSVYSYQLGVSRENARMKQRAIYNGRLNSWDEIVLKYPQKVRRELEDDDNCPEELRDFTWRVLRRCAQPEMEVQARDRINGDFVDFDWRPSKNQLGTVDSSGRVQIWNVSDSTCEFELRLDSNVPPKDSENQSTGICFSPDGANLVGYFGKKVVLWGIENDTTQVFLSRKAELRDVEFSTDGSQLLAATDDELIQWEVSDTIDDPEPYKFPNKKYPIQSIAISPDGRTVSIACNSQDSFDDGQVIILNLENRTTKTFDHPVHFMDYSRDGKLLAFADTIPRDSKVQLINVSEQTLVEPIKNNPVDTKYENNSTRGLEFASDNQLAVVDQDGVIKIWDVQTRRLIRKLFTGEDCYRLKIDIQNQSLAIHARNGSINVLSIQPFPKLSNPSEVECLAFSNDGRRLAVGLQDGTSRVWDVKSQKIVWQNDDLDEVKAIAFSSEGNLVISAGKYSKDNDNKSGRVIFRAANTGEPKLNPIDTDLPIYSMALSPGDQTLATGSRAGTEFVIWGFDGEQLWKSDLRSVTSLAYSSDGTRLVMASFDEIVELDTRRFRKRRTLFDKYGPIGTANHRQNKKAKGDDWEPKADEWDLPLKVVYSANDSLIGSAHRRSNANLWNATSGKHLTRLTEHQGTVTSIGFSPDGQTVVTGGVDNKVRFWDTVLFQIRSEFDVTSWATAIAFSPDGSLMATGHRDGIVQLWPANQGSGRNTSSRK